MQGGAAGKNSRDWEAASQPMAAQFHTGRAHWGDHNLLLCFIYLLLVEQHRAAPAERVPPLEKDHLPPAEVKHDKVDRKKAGTGQKLRKSQSQCKGKHIACGFGAHSPPQAAGETHTSSFPVSKRGCGTPESRQEGKQDGKGHKTKTRCEI